MKQTLAGVLGIGFIILALVLFTRSPEKLSKKVLGVNLSNTPISSPTQAMIPVNHESVLFVPYWGIDGDIMKENASSILVYFGIQPTKDSIDTTDSGYKTMTTFMEDTRGAKKRLLTVRMINTDINNAILANPQAQETIISQAASIAKSNGFDGVVLDFEISAIAFDSVTKSITDFTTNFSKTVHANNLSFYITAYGDTFYHIRPFNIKALVPVSDGLMIMAYDFHKANTDAGPNFPLQGKETYGYDMQEMVSDFLRYANPDKLSVIFGMYGYDWPIDDKRQSLDAAVSITLNQAEKKFFSACLLKNCQVHRDTLSTETEVTYIDAENKKHDVWIDDITSTQEKTAYLQSKGIFSIGYWAYGYF